MLILLGVILGNLCAVAIHVFTWFLRVKHLRLIRGIGIFGLSLWLVGWCGATVVFLWNWAHRQEDMSLEPFWFIGLISAQFYDFLCATSILIGAAYAIGSLQRLWYKAEPAEATLAVCGELTLIFLGLSILV